MRLYELTEQYRQLAELAFDMVDGELPSDLLQALSAIEGDIDQKLAACCRIVRELEASQEAFNAEAKRLRLKCDRCETHVESLKRYMKEQMELCGFTKREVDPIFTVAIQKSPPSLAISNLDAVPHDWDLPVDRKVDTRAIKEAIKDGAVVPGCEIVQGTHLRIR